jgi:hypothetical protein
MKIEALYEIYPLLIRESTPTLLAPLPLLACSDLHSFHIFCHLTSLPLKPIKARLAAGLPTGEHSSTSSILSLPVSQDLLFIHFLRSAAPPTRGRIQHGMWSKPILPDTGESQLPGTGL